MYYIMKECTYTPALAVVPPTLLSFYSTISTSFLFISIFLKFLVAAVCSIRLSTAQCPIAMESASSTDYRQVLVAPLSALHQAPYVPVLCSLLVIEVPCPDERSSSR